MTDPRLYANAPAFVSANIPESLPSTSAATPESYPVGGLIRDSKEYGNFVANSKTNPGTQGLGYKPPEPSSSSSLTGIIGGAAYIGTGIISSLMQNQVANRALDLEYTKFDRNWKAANEAGLLSPDQFTTLGTGASYFRNTGAGAISTKHAFAKNYSSFS